jgi:hypothetical protein
MKNLKLIKQIHLLAGKRALSVIGAGAILALLVFVAIGSVQAAGAGEAEKSYGPIGFIFNFLNKQPIVFLLLALGFGYPLGRVAVKGISLDRQDCLRHHLLGSRHSRLGIPVDVHVCPGA